MIKYPAFPAAFVYIQCVSIATGVMWRYGFRATVTVNTQPLILTLIIGVLISSLAILSSIGDTYDQPKSERDTSVAVMGWLMIAVGIVMVVMLST